MKLFVCVALATVATVEGVMNQQKLRFLKNYAAQTAVASAHASNGELTAAKALPAQNFGNSPLQYTYASPSGNGNADLSSPLYGAYAKNYGPVSQLLTQTSGYGGFPSSVDPLGFNQQTANWTAGALQIPEDPSGNHHDHRGQPYGPGQPASPGQGLFRPFPGTGGFPFGVFPGNQFPGGSMGAFPGTAAPYANGMPITSHPYNNGVFPSGGSAISGTIPSVAPNGRSSGMTMGNTYGTPVYSGTPAFGMQPHGGMQYPGIASPLNPSYQTNMMLQRQATMGGSVFKAPGFFQPTAQSYPAPGLDRYGSVADIPYPPNYGKPEPKAGAAAPAA